MSYRSAYLDPRFVWRLGDLASIRRIVEVGARDLLDAIELCEHFPAATVHAFECNPDTLPACRSNLAAAGACRPRLHLVERALGAVPGEAVFRRYMEENPGASSFLPRVDAAKTQRPTERPVPISTLADEARTLGLDTVDLLCMDVQGYELNVLRGAGDLVGRLRFVIMEEPKPKVSWKWLWPGVHSKYVGAPTSREIGAFMRERGFAEVERIAENDIEDNVMYARGAGRM